jgi:hypothetical protein
VVKTPGKSSNHLSFFLFCLLLFSALDFLFLAEFSQAQSTGTKTASKNLSAWFSGAEEAKKYSTIRNEVELLALNLGFSGLGEGLLVDRLVEGSQKRIPAEKLLAALRDETRRLQSVARLLNERGLFPVGEADGPAAEASLLLRAGLGEGEFAAALDATADLTDLKAPLPKVQRVLSALSTVLAIHTRFQLEAGDRQRLTAALVLSKVPRERFGSLVSLFARGKASGLPQSRISSVVIEFASSGATMERIERELERRIRTP